MWDVLSECEQKSHPNNPLLTTKDCEEKLRLLKAARRGGLDAVPYSKMHGLFMLYNILLLIYCMV